MRMWDVRFNRLKSFCVDEEKLSGKYKTILTKIEDLKLLNQMLYQSMVTDI